jgi:hypothetical protein
MHVARIAEVLVREPVGKTRLEDLKVNGDDIKWILNRLEESRLDSAGSW